MNYNNKFIIIPIFVKPISKQEVVGDPQPQGRILQLLSLKTGSSQNPLIKLNALNFL